MVDVAPPKRKIMPGTRLFRHTLLFPAHPGAGRTRKKLSCRKILTLCKAPARTAFPRLPDEGGKLCLALPSPTETPPHSPRTQGFSLPEAPLPASRAKPGSHTPRAGGAPHRLGLRKATEAIPLAGKTALLRRRFRRQRHAPPPARVGKGSVRGTFFAEDTPGKPRPFPPRKRCGSRFPGRARTQKGRPALRQRRPGTLRKKRPISARPLPYNTSPHRDAGGCRRGR